MKIFGIELHRPSFWSFTFAVGFSVLFWSLFVMLGIAGPTAVKAGATLVAILFGAITQACGLTLFKGPKYMAVYAVGCFLLLMLYDFITTVLM